MLSVIPRRGAVLGAPVGVRLRRRNPTSPTRTRSAGRSRPGARGRRWRSTDPACAGRPPTARRGRTGGSPAGTAGPTRHARRPVRSPPGRTPRPRGNVAGSPRGGWGPCRPAHRRRRPLRGSPPPVRRRSRTCRRRPRPRTWRRRCGRGSAPSDSAAPRTRGEASRATTTRIAAWPSPASRASGAGRPSGPAGFVGTKARCGQSGKQQGARDPASAGTGRHPILRFGA